MLDTPQQGKMHEGSICLCGKQLQELDGGGSGKEDVPGSNR